MNRIESGFFRLAGVKPESPGVKWYSIAALDLFSKTDRLLHRTSYEGDLLPESGPAIMVVNHTSAWDIAKGYGLGQRSHRLIRTWAKHTLFDPKARESQEVRERTNHKSDLLNPSSGFHRWWKHPLSKIVAAVVRGAEAIPVVREGSFRDIQQLIDRSTEELEAEHIIAAFGQETRHKDGRLVGVKQGAELLAMLNPDITLYACLMARSRICLQRLGTYNQLCADPEYGWLAKDYLTVLIFDSIAGMADPEIRQDWHQIQRPKLLPGSVRNPQSG